VDNTTVVECDHLTNLAKEFRAMRDEIAAQIERFTTRSGDPGDAYGRLPASGTTASHYRATIEDLLNQLGAIRDEYGAHANSLRTAALTYRETDEHSARQLERASQRGS
jgi:uncharacterized protein YukE